MWLRAWTEHKKKLNKTRRHRMLMACNLYMCNILYSQRLHLIINMFHGGSGGGGGGGGGGLRVLRPPTFRLRLWPHNMQHFKTKTIWYLPSLAPCEVCLRASRITCIIIYLLLWLIMNFTLEESIIIIYAKYTRVQISRFSYYLYLQNWNYEAYIKHASLPRGDIWYCFGETTLNCVMRVEIIFYHLFFRTRIMSFHNLISIK